MGCDFFLDSENVPTESHWYQNVCFLLSCAMVRRQASGASLRYPIYPKVKKILHQLGHLLPRWTGGMGEAFHMLKYFHQICIQLCIPSNSWEAWQLLLDKKLCALPSLLSQCTSTLLSYRTLALIILPIGNHCSVPGEFLCNLLPPPGRDQLPCSLGGRQVHCAPILLCYFTHCLGRFPGWQGMVASGVGIRRPPLYQLFCNFLWE